MFHVGGLILEKFLPKINNYILYHTCVYMLGDITLPSRVQEAMQMQVEAERKKRATILESEGIREAEINVAEGKRLARILASGAVLFIFSVAPNQRI